jgi:small subunit ribosomal protein S6
MTAYEIMLLLDSELADERQDEILTRARELVERRGGTWQGQEAWGRRKLAYEIRHKPETLEELSRVLKITDGALRHMAVRRPAGSRPLRETAAPPAEAVTPAE